MESSRALPQSLEAERAVLGALMLEPRQLDTIREIVHDEMFYPEVHRKIFALMVSMHDAGQPPEMLALVDRIMSTEDQEEYGGVAYVSSLPERVPTTRNIEYYAEMVRDKAIRRRLIEVSHEITQAVSKEHDLEVLLDSAESAVFSVSQGRKQKDWYPLPELIDVEYQRIQQNWEKRGSVTGVTTGYVDLDQKLAGFQPGDLIILAARPAMGKTALALNFVRHAAMEGGVAAAMFSLEMPKGQLASRMLCAEGKVDAERVRSGYLRRDEEWPALADAAETLHQVPIYIDDTPALTVNQVRSKARRLKAERPDLGLVAIDYLQLMQGSGGPRESREQAISSISRGLKGLAKELEIPVLALAQLNRGVEGRPDKRPMMSDLRESGAIEQDADVVMFIYRDDYYNQDSEEPGIAELIIGKQRNGPTGKVKLVFQGKYLRFDSAEKRRGEEGVYVV